MERKTSSLRFTRGRLAALLSAVVLVTIVVFSLTFLSPVPARQADGGSHSGGRTAMGL